MRPFAIGIFALLLAACTMPTWAHTGGLAEDGCHKDNSIGERHWHLPDTSVRGGPCVDGQKHIVFQQMTPAPDCIQEVYDWQYVNESLDYSWAETAEYAETAILCLTGEDE